jgi:hypothetical protein
LIERKLERCHNEKNIAFTNETAAEVLGMTSAYICPLYIGDRKHEDGYLKCVAEKLDERDKLLVFSGVRVTDPVSTLCHIVDRSQLYDWGLRAILNFCSVADFDFWHDEIAARKLQDKWNYALDVAYDLGIITIVQRRDWSGESEHQYYQWFWDLHS